MVCDARSSCASIITRALQDVSAEQQHSEVQIVDDDDPPLDSEGGVATLREEIGRTLPALEQCPIQDLG